MIVIVTSCLSLAACNVGEDGSQEPVRGLKIFVIADTERVSVRRFPGVLEPSNLNTLSFEVGGSLLDFDLAVGQQIAAGEVVARLDPSSLELQVRSAEAGVMQAETVAENAAAALARQEALLSSGTTTVATVANARTEAQSAAASLVQAQQSLATAEENLGDATLVAPFDGIVNSVDVSPFQTISSGTPVVSLYDPSAFTVSFSVSFDIADRLVVGTPANVRLADRPEITLDALVSELGARADAVSSFPVVVSLQEIDPLMKAGMAVETSISFPLPAQEGYSVPLSVIIRDGNADSVSEGERVSAAGIYVYDPATSTVIRRQVAVGGIRDNRIILLDGVAPGERIASAGVQFLRDGQKVKLLDEDR
ncbi:efflux RND transporter periplasmic adaptor subunit [Hoeflea sp. YIM 152468]|uniref:efflux RND transporter periplasmic adaptor subunit n=1 Tax=Hoeflea sp. YIM 152468 TaxID=3031759 RepID=UPI0023DC9207|nr:efflux RND transporter periplasmic adaptor subunit [Hoeflea sp. YIM 152468]MDF1608872.1 efflux RND transporter periplasmic adaptor subunit [Hoeflea sp. YIM 152468]